jgi:hypothetical protein
MDIEISVIMTITRLWSKVVVMKIDYKSLIEHQPRSENVSYQNLSLQTTEYDIIQPKKVMGYEILDWTQKRVKRNAIPPVLNQNQLATNKMC